MTNIFVAPKIKVGFQKREDCFTKKLAYVIYYDEKGKIRKEKSWESWRNKDIPVEEYDNAPISGFTLNKDIKRYNGDWFSSKRTLIRVHDPRGFEFEVTTENLIAILMHTDCSKRGLIGEFVYAWSGPELVLLPTNSEEYTNATKYTSGLSKKVKVKELIPGCSYKTKKSGDIVYVGRFNWYEHQENKMYYNVGGSYIEHKQTLVFTKDNGKTFERKDSVSFLSELNSETPVVNYGELIEQFNSKIYANRIVSIEPTLTQFNPDYTQTEDQYYHPFSMVRPVYFINCGDNEFKMKTFATDSESKRSKEDPQKYERVFTGYVSDENDYSGHYVLNIKDFSVRHEDRNQNGKAGWAYNYRPNNILSLDSINLLKLYDLTITFENGKKVVLKQLSDLATYSSIKL